MSKIYRRNKNDTIVLQDNLWQQIIKHFGLSLKGNKLNLACGPDYKEGWTNLDGNQDIKADTYCDLDATDLELPFQKDRFDFVLASHIFEHIWYLPRLKSELARIIKPGGKLVVVVPEATSPDAWGDDTHCRAFQKSSFNESFWPGFDLQGLMHVNVEHPATDIMGLYIWLVGCLVRTL